MPKPIAVRRSAAFVLVLLTMLGFTYAEFFRLSAVSRAQADREAAAADRQERIATLNAAGRGTPHFGFEDGRELLIGDAAGGSQPVAMTSADFDSDGFADVAVADSTGAITLLKGRDPSVFAMQPKLPPSEQPKPEPFTAVPTGASLGFGPDRIFSGDFNADGKPDILGFANGALGLRLLSGDGHGHFSPPSGVDVGGAITAAESGEIGKPDGQADLAVAFTNEKGSFVAIFEHPESAFRHPPEIIKLPSRATSIAIGNTDEDFYSDVAVACGNQLVLIHERGQVYPWDIMPESGIERPRAVVEIRTMPASIVSMAVGRFGEKRGTSLAILGVDGRILRLEPVRKFEPTPTRTVARRKMSGPPVMPTDREAANYAVVQSPIISGSSDASGNPLVDFSEMRTVGKNEYFKKRADELAKNPANFTPEELAKTTVQVKAKSAAMEKVRREAFLRSVSPRTTLLKDWAIETIASDPGLASAANAGGRLDRVNVSDSNLDDLMVSAAGTGEIRLVSRQKNAGAGYRAEIATISAIAGATRSVLPVRLNLDALDDLLVLSDGRPTPSVVMTAPQSVIYVTSADDSTVCNPYPDTCTLRGAILAANSSPGTDIVAFAISNSTSIIQLQSQLPVITDPISMQAGNRPDGSKFIEISGNDIPGAADGLKLRSSNNFVWGLAINGMPNTLGGGAAVGGNGITLESTSSSPNNGNNYVVGLYLGTDATGTISKPNASTGMLIFDSDNNAVGGGGIGFRNVMSGNDTGGSYGLDVTVGNSNNFQNNVIGLDATGVIKLANANGVFLSGANNQFGGDFADQGNTVSGNGIPYVDEPNRCYGSGVFIASIYDALTLEPLTLNSTLRGNRIGTDAGGTLPIGNCTAGIYTSPLHQTTIGSITETGRNVIADNGFTAIRCVDEISDISQLSEGGFCAIAGNNIGTDVTGNVAMGNDDRNFLGGFYRVFGNVDLYLNLSYSYFGAPGGTTPGGDCTGFCNLYSGNAIVNAATASHFNDDIYVTGFSNVAITNNLIGTNRSGTAALPNYSGIVAGSMFGDLFVGGVGDDNGNEVALGNLISGQKFTGLSVTGGFANGNCPGNGTSLLVQGNKIGTDINGSTAIPNGGGENGSGMTSAAFIFRGYADSGSFGGANPLARNIISGNASDGILLSDACFASLPVNLPVTNNLIGVSESSEPLGNGGVGIRAAASFLILGGSVPNAIAFNGAGNPTPQAGVQVTKTGNYPAVAVSIRNNSIHDNNGLGIDLGGFRYDPPDGVTINDTCERDADLGPNRLQNFPVLSAPSANPDGSVTVTGTLLSTPFQHFTVDFYADQTVDTSGHGEGEIPLDSVGVTADGNGSASFSWTSVAPFSPGQSISATATDDYGNTSEFSCIAGQSCADLANVAGSVSAEGQGCPVSIIVNIESDEPDVTGDNVCDVDTQNSGLQCSLRAALELVNDPGYQGSRTITFDIPGAGVHTITPASPLPTIVKSVDLRGTSQPGYLQNGSPKIEISGIDQTTGGGLILASGSGGSRISGLTINRFVGDGVLIQSDSNSVELCYIGWNSAGTDIFPDRPLSNGIKVTGGDNQIGGNSSTSANFLMGASLNQILITGAAATGNRVYGNYVGVLGDRHEYLSAFTTGISVAQSASQNIIGGETQELSNDVEGQVKAGIELIDAANHNKVLHNLVLHCFAAIAVTRANNNQIGMKTVGSENEILTLADNVVGVFLGDDDVPRPYPAFADSPPSLDESRAAYVRLFRSKTDRVAAPSEIQTHDNTVWSCYAGMIPDLGIAGSVVGIDLSVAYNNKIGAATGATEGYGNRTNRNNIVGILLRSGAIQNIVRGNVSGVGTDGTTPEPNEIGLIIRGKNNTIEKNTISGNTNGGVNFERVSDVTFPTGNKLTMNHIGTDATGNVKVANAVGIALDGEDNDIGLPGRGNVISGNDGAGIGTKEYGINNRITGNLIGIKEDQSGPLGNSPGIDENAGFNRIIDNTISGNNFVGVAIRKNPLFQTAPRSTVLIHNFIGTDSTGQFAVRNNGWGVLITNGASNNTIGGRGPGEGNVISGNYDVGVFISILLTAGPDTPRGNQLYGNLIGTNVDGNSAIPNEKGGVLIGDSDNNTVGGWGTDLPGARNVISGNRLSGVAIIGANSFGQRIQGNFIGVGADGSALGNTGSGIFIGFGAHNNVIGGQFPGAGNRVENNGRNGVALEQAGQGNSVDPNSIAANGMRGITLNETADPVDENAPPPQPLENDPGDVDEGSNRQQNYPEISDVTIDGIGDLIVTYLVDSDPENSNYGDDGIYVEFFKSDLYGQGETFLGSDQYTLADHDQMFGGRFGTVRPSTPSAGSKILNLGNAAALGFQPGDMMTATATDADGNTSEFFPPFAPTAAHASIGGQVLAANGLPLLGVRLTLTDLDGNSSEAMTGSFGRYRFDNVEVGRAYVLTVKSRKYNFANPSRLIDLADDISDADFTASP